MGKITNPGLILGHPKQPFPYIADLHPTKTQEIPRL
jgi:hypothetical protein